MKYVKSCMFKGAWSVLKVLALGVCLFLLSPQVKAAGVGNFDGNYDASKGFILGGGSGDYSGDPVDGTKVTELDFIKWLVNLTGDTPLFDTYSTVGDYVYWARKYKMTPKGGWHPDAYLTQSRFAELLVDFYRLKPKGSSDIETLEREGITVPDMPIITWDGLISVVDDYGFQSRLSVFSHLTCSPVTGQKHQITTKKCTPPPPPVAEQDHRLYRKFKEKKASKI